MLGERTRCLRRFVLGLAATAMLVAISLLGVGYTPYPEIDVQRPQGTSISDHGTDNVGTVALGALDLTYIIDNTDGAAELTVQTDGVVVSALVNCRDFTVMTTLPLTVPIGSSAPLDVSLTIESSAPFSCDMEIANNDQNENPYHIRISGSADEDPPAKPAMPDLDPGSDSGESNTDDITQVDTPTFFGSAGSVEANATVEIQSTVGGSLGTSTADGDGAWSYTVPGGSALAEGVHGITIRAIDAAGNPSEDSDVLTVVIDTTQPSVTIDHSSQQSDPTNHSHATFTVNFDEPIDPTTFVGSDVDVTGTATTGVVSVIPVGGSDDKFFVVSIRVNADGIVIAALPAGRVEDRAGNTNHSSTSIDNEVTIDNVVDVTIDQAGSQDDPTHESPVRFTVVFDAAIVDTTFVGTDVDVGGTAAIGTVTVTEVAPNDGTTFEVSIEATGEGTVVPMIPAGCIQDPIGNTNNASTSADNEITYDTTKPDVTLEQASGQADPTNTSPIRFTAVFSEPINDATFTGADASVVGTATTGSVTVIEVAPMDGTTFELSVVVTGEGTVAVSIPAGRVEDLAGNVSNTSTGTDDTVTYDTTKPSVTMYHTGQSDPTSSSHAMFGVIFDEPIDPATFVGSDVEVTGTATVGMITVAPVQGTDDQRFVVWVRVNADGTVIAALPAGRVEDRAGNTNHASTSTDNEVRVDTTDPEIQSVTSTTLDGRYGVGQTTNVTITFTEPVTLSGGTMDFRLNVSSPEYTISVLPFDDSAVATTTYTVLAGHSSADLDTTSVACNGTVRDEAGNETSSFFIPPTSIADGSDIVIETTPPTVIGFAVDTPTIRDSDLTQQVTIDYSEPMDTNVKPTVAITGITTPKSDASGGTWISNQQYVVTVTLADDDETDGELEIEVSGAVDAAQNLQTLYTASNPFSVDTENPSIDAIFGSPDPISDSEVGSSTFTITVEYGESMDDSGANDPVLGFPTENPTSTITFESASWPSADTYVATYSVVDADETVDGIDVRVSGGIDTNGNAFIATTESDVFDIDTENPWIVKQSLPYGAGIDLTDGLVTDYDAERSVGFHVIAYWSERMDTSTLPTFTFTPDVSSTLVADGVVWHALPSGDRAWASYQVHDANVDVDSVAIDVEGARDLAGNPMVDFPVVHQFEIDTQNPAAAVAVDTNPVCEGDLTQQVTVVYGEAMHTAAIPSVVFSHGTWTEEVGSRVWSAGDTTFTVTYTLTDNDEEFYDPAAGTNLVTVEVTGGQDPARNNQSDFVPQSLFDIDTLQPTLVNATSSSGDGCYGDGATIDVGLTFSEDVALGSNDLQLILDVGGSRPHHVEIGAWGVPSDVASGIYTVADGEGSCDLTLSSYQTTVDGTLVDWAGNEIDFELPSAGSNIADHKAIIVDAGSSVAVDDPNGDEDRSGSDDSLFTQLREDFHGQHRLATREDTPMYIDVIFNDSDLPCADYLAILDIPAEPEHGVVSIEPGTGRVRYSPDRSYIGPDRFTYRFVDGCGHVSGEATVYVEVLRQLVLEDTYVTVCSGQPSQVEVTVFDPWIDPEDPDGMPFEFTMIGPPENGVISGDLTALTYAAQGTSSEELGSVTWALTYVPALGFTGQDRMVVEVTDPFGDSIRAMVSISVTACEGTPTAVPLGTDELLPIIVPPSFATVYQTAPDTVTLTDAAGVAAYADRLSVAWDEDIGRHILTVDASLLPPGTYELTVPLGNGETVELTIEAQ